MCSLCLGGKGKEEVGYLSKSLDSSFSMNVNGEMYHLRCSEKSVNLMYIFSDILKAVRFHKWQVNRKWGYCNFQRKVQQLLSVCIFYLGGQGTVIHFAQVLNGCQHPSGSEFKSGTTSFIFTWISKQFCEQSL